MQKQQNDIAKYDPYHQLKSKKSVNSSIKEQEKMKNYILVMFIMVSIFSCSKNENPAESTRGTVTDIDGNVYDYVTIGSQVWMAENLKTTRFRNGDAIPNVTDNTEWQNMATAAYCSYDNYLSDKTAHGRLYNWYAVNDARKIAPLGWHIPTDDEWKTLINYLGGDSVAGGKLKKATAGNSEYSYMNATNETRFTALLCGYRNYGDGTFSDMDKYGTWWSSTEATNLGALSRYMHYSHNTVLRYSSNKSYGFSVRCIKDN